MSTRARSVLLAAALAWSAPAAAQGATVTTYPVPTGDAGLAGIAKAPDGSLWVTERKGGKLARVGLDGAIAEFAVPDKTPGDGSADVPVGPTSIVADASGATMDFLTDQGSSVGFATLAGQITTYHDTANNAQSISAAKGGGVWEVFYLSFDDPRLTAALVRPDGRFTGFAADSRLGFSPMATAPDGRMFWAEGVDTLHSYSEATAAAGGDPQTFPLPPGNESEDVTSLAFDANGTLRYTQYDTGSGREILARGGRLGVVAANGQASTVDLGGDYLPTSLVLGPDRAMWWAEKNGIGRLDPSGAVQHASLGSFDPDAIAFGGDGALWFTDATANRVGRVRIDTGTFPTPTGPAAGSRAPAIRLRASTQRLGTVRGRKAIRLDGTLAGAGTLSVRATIAASVGRRLGLKPAKGATAVTLASASRTFTKAGTAPITLKLGTRARAALRRARASVRVTLRATSRRKGTKSVTATRSLTLKR